MSILAQRLKKSREAKNLSQVEVSSLTGINNKTLSGYENNVGTPDISTLSRLADLYGVTLDYLAGRVDSPAEIKMSLFNQSQTNFDKEIEKRAMFWNDVLGEDTDLGADDISLVKKLVETLRGHNVKRK